MNREVGREIKRADLQSGQVILGQHSPGILSMIHRSAIGLT